ncbi:peptidoglycan bridge formation glycyltransferase FemA/FemB family protein [Granulicatella sp. zg-ZJ]|nr:peptidoglycan bridge formation glycyltransferase FemA/FemB family protein [Granulicatella sp. zg-ZJ]
MEINMSVIVKKVTDEIYKQSQLNYSTSNFLQSTEIASTQLERRNFLDSQRVVFEKNGHVIGQAIINIRKRYRFFKEAIILQGPLLDYTNMDIVKECFEALEIYFKHEKVSRFMIHPYLIQQQIDTSLNIVKDNQYNDVIDYLTSCGYVHTVHSEDTVHVVGQMFVKPLHQYDNEEAIYDAFSNALKRDLKKFDESHVKVRELQEDELDTFYRILVSTGGRKGFAVQPFLYFELLKKYFKKDARFMLAYLDCKAYTDYLQNKIDAFQNRIVELESSPLSKKTKGYITDAKDQLQSYVKRQEQFEQLHVTETFLPLSSYLFMCYGQEVVSILGGSYREYLNFGGSTMINWDMIRYAYRENKDYNFYGTIEVADSQNKTGNFNYKRQFGGELNVLIGSFTKTINPLMHLVEKIKK